MVRTLARGFVCVCASALVAGATASVADAAPPTNLALPTITGTFRDGETLTATTGDWLGATGYAYQWQRCNAYTGLVRQDAPLSWWRLGEASGVATAADAGSVGAGGTYFQLPIMGAQGALSGDADTAVAFRGGSLVNLPGAGYPTGRSPVTIEAWLNLRVAVPSGAKNGVAGYGGSASGNNAFFLGAAYSASGSKLFVRLGGESYTSTGSSLQPATWYHVALVDIGTTISLYLNGTLNGSFTPTPGYGRLSQAGGIGRFASWDTSFPGTWDGSIDEVAIYSSALSQARLQAHYDAGSQPSGGLPCTDIAGATDAIYNLGASDVDKRIRVTVTATAADSSTSSASSYSNVVLPAPPVNTSPPTVSGTPELGQTLTGGPGSWTGTPPVSFSYQWQRCGYFNAVRSDNALSYWRLDEASGTVVRDVGSAAINGTYLNAPTFGAAGALSSDPNDAVTFNGSTQAVDLPAGPYPTGRSPVTVEGWFKIKSGATGRFAIAGYGGNSSGNNSLYIFIQSNQVYVRTGGNAYPGTQTIRDDTWYHVAAVDNGTTITEYVNGAVDGTFTPDGTYSRLAQIGQIARLPAWDTNLGAAFFNGTLDEIAIYPSALSASRIQAHYQAASNATAAASCTDIGGATGTTYTVASGDVGTKLRLKVTATNSAGTTIAYSDGTSASNVPPTNASPPLVTGDPTVGQTLTTSNGAWNGTTPFTYGYQWQRCTGSNCTNITGATSATYLLITADGNTSVRSAVTATNSAGASTAYSSSTPIAPTGIPTNSALPSVSGTPIEGQTLSATNGSWGGTPTSFAYQWRRCSYRQQVLTDQPNGYWRLGEATGNTAADGSGSLNTGTYGTTVALGIPGALPANSNLAANFDGSANANVQIPDANSLDLGDAFTLEAWVIHTTGQAGTVQRLFDKGANGFIFGADGTDHLLLAKSGDVTIMTSSVLIPKDGHFHHVAVTKSGITVKLYLDGADAGGTVVSNHAIQNTTTPLQIGAGYPWFGAIDEAAVYPSALTSTRIQAHYSAAACANIAGATSATYTLTSADSGADVGIAVTASNGNGSATANSAEKEILGVAPTYDSPRDTAGIGTKTPTLKLVAITGTPDYLFQVAADDQFNTVKAMSGWLPSTNSYVIPTTASLNDAQTYYWRARERHAGKLSAWTATRSFTIRIDRFGVRDYWPMWSHGPIAVNEATGNLVVSVPTPSYPTATDPLTAALTYNSLDTNRNKSGLGTGWTFGHSPADLLDHSVLSGSGKLGAAEITFEDGSTEYFNEVGDTGVYDSEPGDTGSLEQNGDGGWTYHDEETGQVIEFGAADGSGEAYVKAAEIKDADSGNGRLTYYYDAANPTKLTGIADPSNRRLDFLWPGIAPPGSCSGGLLCMQGPDTVKWRYIGVNYSTGKLARVNNGTRDIMALAYDANGRVIKIQNANDLDPTHASPGYNGAHSVQITYDANGRVASVSDGPIANQTPSTSSWTFDYHTGSVTTAPTRAEHTSTPAGTARSADGYTDVIPPRQQGQPNPKATRVYYDDLGHPIQVTDVLGNVTLAAYNERDQQLWSEDADGNPTDNGWDSFNNVLESVTRPDPDSAGPLGRGVTRYRYDELTIGTPSAAGLALHGLRGSYYKNITLSGRPAVRRTDSVVNEDWGTGAPAALPGTSDNFSASWQGTLTTTNEGDYTFSTFADAGTRVIVDGIAAISNWVDGPARNFSSQPIHLTAGLHKLTLEYYSKTGSSEVHLRWGCAGCSPAITQQVIPVSQLAPAWLNQTSTVSPTGRIGFSHFAFPSKAESDYALRRLSGGTNVLTSFSYDPWGRVTQKVMPKGNAARTLALDGTLQGAFNAAYATSWTYYSSGATAATPGACGTGPPAVDQAQRLKTKSMHGTATTTFVYDSAGRAVAETNGRGSTCRTYDNEGRKSSERAPGESQETAYTYDPAGAMRAATDAAGTVISDYDEAGRALRNADSYAAEASFRYDAEGNLVLRSAAAGPPGSNPIFTSQYGYNDGGELTSVIDPAGRNYGFAYDTRGDLRSIQYPNGTFAWYEFNNAGWITAVFNRHGVVPDPLPAVAPSDASPLDDVTYEYDADGLRTQEGRHRGGLADTTTAYTYDELSRLGQAMLPDGTLRQYSFDLDSNRTAVTDNGSQVTTYQYDTASAQGVDQLGAVTNVASSQTDTFAYTSDGDAIRRGSDILTWDGRGRLSGGTFSGTAIAYGFDPVGFRRSRTAGSATTRYLLGGLYEADAANAIQMTDVDGPQADLAHYAGPPTTSTGITFLYYNGHGDVVAEADLGGARTASFTYGPYGEPIPSGTGSGTVERWTGRWDKKTDSSSGLIEMGQRTYDPLLGRFLSVDPVEGGALNAYDYAGQNPITGYDLDGRMTGGPGGLLAAAAGKLADAAIAIVVGKRVVRVTVRTKSGLTLRGVAKIASTAGKVTGAAVGAAVSQALADALGGRDLSDTARAGRIVLAVTAGAAGASSGAFVGGVCMASTLGFGSIACAGAGIAVGVGVNWLARKALSPVSQAFGWGGL